MKNSCPRREAGRFPSFIGDLVILARVCPSLPNTPFCCGVVVGVYSTLILALMHGALTSLPVYSPPSWLLPVKSMTGSSSLEVSISLLSVWIASCCSHKSGVYILYTQKIAFPSSAVVLPKYSTPRRRAWWCGELNSTWLLLCRLGLEHLLLVCPRSLQLKEMMMFD